MFLPTMTQTEIYKEATRDFRTLLPRGLQAFSALRQELKRKKIPYYKHTMKLRLASMNEWNIGMIFNNPGTSDVFFYSLTWDHIGQCAYVMQEHQTDTGTELYMAKFTTHFFKRYNERMKLGNTDSTKTMKHFFANNLEYNYIPSQIEPDGTHQMYCGLKAGLGVGWRHPSDKVICMKTFISEDLYHKHQKKLAAFIREDINEIDFQIKIKDKHRVHKF